MPLANECIIKLEITKNQYNGGKICGFTENPADTPSFVELSTKSELPVSLGTIFMYDNPAKEGAIEAQ